MSWWTGANVEPKRKSRFIVEIANGFFLPNVKTCSKPSANVDLKEFQLINHKFKYPGVVTWQDIKITMIDMNGNSGEIQSLDTGLLLWRMLKHTGYNLPTEAVGPIAALGPNRQLSTTEKASSIANGFGRGLYGKADFGPAGVNSPSSNAQSVRIYTLDPEGNTVETWTLHNPQIKAVNWGDHSYDSDEFVEYSLDISYDFAHLEKGKKVTVGPELDDTPSMNTPVSIGTKYNEFISILQGGKAFQEIVADKRRQNAKSFEEAMKKPMPTKKGYFDVKNASFEFEGLSEQVLNPVRDALNPGVYLETSLYENNYANKMRWMEEDNYSNRPPIDIEGPGAYQIGAWGADMENGAYTNLEGGGSNIITIIKSKNKGND